MMVMVCVRFILNVTIRRMRVDREVARAVNWSKYGVVECCGKS